VARQGTAKITNKKSVKKIYTADRKTCTLVNYMNAHNNNQKYKIFVLV